MAVRLNRRHQDAIRQKIQAGVLIDRLHKAAMGDIEVTTAQIRSAEILLNKSIPNLQNVSVDGGEDSEGNVLPVSINVELVKSANS